MSEEKKKTYLITEAGMQFVVSKPVFDIVNELRDEIDDLEDEVDKQKEVLDKIKPILEELKNLYDDNYTVSDKVGDILELLEEIE